MNVIQNPIRGKGLKNFHTICPGNIIDEHAGVIKLLNYCPIAKKTAAEMSLDEKQKYSHRGKSLKNILTAHQIEQLDIDLSLRPENLSVSDYVRIAEELI